MGTKLTPDMIRSAASMIDLDLAKDEIEPVRERLQTLLDVGGLFVHLTDDHAELDLRFEARWEVEPA